jgi:hypothetical protein
MGVADASLLHLATKGIPLITGVTGLYIQASSPCERCINFSKVIIDEAYRRH